VVFICSPVGGVLRTSKVSSSVLGDPTECRALRHWTTRWPPARGEGRGVLSPDRLLWDCGPEREPRRSSTHRLCDCERRHDRDSEQARASVDATQPKGLVLPPVRGVNVSATTFGPAVTGQFTNPYHAQLPSHAVVYAVFINANGKIVAGGQQPTQAQVLPGATVSSSVPVDLLSDIV
jgi:hypothetical protein